MLVDDYTPGARDIWDDDDSMNESSDDEQNDPPGERRQLHRIVSFIENRVHLSDNEEFRRHFHIKREYTDW